MGVKASCVAWTNTPDILDRCLSQRSFYLNRRIQSYHALCFWRPFGESISEFCECLGWTNANGNRDARPLKERGTYGLPISCQGIEWQHGELQKRLVNGIDFHLWRPLRERRHDPC